MLDEINQQLVADREIVRVLRVLEYVGPRKHVRDVIAKSLPSETQFGTIVIRSATLPESGPFTDLQEKK